MIYMMYMENLPNYDKNIFEQKDFNKDVKYILEKEAEFEHSLKESLRLLAEHFSKLEIVPNRILVKSWLMGNDALRKKIGFKKISEQDFDSKRGSEIWGQFIDKDGNLKRKELEFLFKNNHLRYKLTKAGLPFEEFIQKYGK